MSEEVVKKKRNRNQLSANAHESNRLDVINIVGRSYHERYGDEWESKFNVVNMKFCYSEELMNYVTEESLIYPDTIYQNNFKIFRDGLSA